MLYHYIQITSIGTLRENAWQNQEFYTKKLQYVEGSFCLRFTNSNEVWHHFKEFSLNIISYV